MCCCKAPSCCGCCRVFQPTKNAFVDTLRSVVADVKWFLLFLVLTMWGFAGAFYILFREDQQQFQASLSTFMAAVPQPVCLSVCVCVWVGVCVRA